MYFMKIIRIKREYLIHDSQQGLFLFIKFNFIISVIDVKLMDSESQMTQKTCKKQQHQKSFLSHSFVFYPSVDTMISQCVNFWFSVYLHNTKSFLILAFLEIWVLVNIFVTIFYNR